MFREHMPIIDRRVETTLTREHPNSHAAIWDSQRPPPPPRKAGLFSHVRYTIAEIFWLIRMGVILLINLGLVGKWCFMAIRLGLYAFFLGPAWAILGYTYFFSPYIKRGVRYGKFNRNFCDLYLPSNAQRQQRKHKVGDDTHLVDDMAEKVPVVIFLSGGAWTIGYKAWGALLGIGLQRHGVLLVSVDYRNFPQGKIGDMIDDASNSISWVTANIHRYGGDVNNIYFVGQSAGGHICALTCMMKARREREQLLKDLEHLEHTVIQPSSKRKQPLHSIAEATANSSPSMRERSNTTILDGTNTVHQHIDNTNGTSNAHTANSAVKFHINTAAADDDLYGVYDYHKQINHTNGDAEHNDIDADQDMQHDEHTPHLDGRPHRRHLSKMLQRTKSLPRPLIDASVVSPVKHRPYNYSEEDKPHSTPSRSRTLINLGTMHCSCCIPSMKAQRSRSASLNGAADASHLTSPKRRVAITQPKWTLSQIKCLIGVSGVYNLVEAEHQMEAKGLPPYVLHSIMGSTRGVAHELHTVDDGYRHTQAPMMAWSPTLLANSQWFKSVVALFPPVLLLHGTKDTSSLWTASEQYGRALANSGCKVAVKYYDGATHTDPIIEGPMAGHDHLIFDVLAVIHRMSQQYKKKLERRQTRAQSVAAGESPPPSDADESDGSDADTIVPPPKVAGYVPTSAETSDHVESVPDFELANETEIQAIYNVKPAKPIIPLFLINCARYVNPF